MGLPYLIGLYAEALGDSGRLDDAGKSVEAALELGRSQRNLFPTRRSAEDQGPNP